MCTNLFHLSLAKTSLDSSEISSSPSSLTSCASKNLKLYTMAPSRATHLKSLLINSGLTSPTERMPYMTAVITEMPSSQNTPLFKHKILIFLTIGLSEEEFFGPRYQLSREHFQSSAHTSISLSGVEKISSSGYKLFFKK